MILYCIHSVAGPPTIEEAAARLGLPLAALDLDYGVVLLDPIRGIYSIGIFESADRKDVASQPGVSGPWANPGIEPFGGRPETREPPADKSARE